MKKEKQKFNLTNLPEKAIIPIPQQKKLKGGGGGIVEEEAQGI